MRHPRHQPGLESVPSFYCATVIVGSGAAALNCAEHLGRALAARGLDPGEHLAIVTAALGGGASFRSGSDKQTYYRLGTLGEQALAPRQMAQALTAGGCCHGDLALVEAENSLREFHHLVELGVPFPHNRYGAFVGYRTDHDPYQCATSAGPGTSRLMSEALLAAVQRLGVPIVNGCHAAALLTTGEGPDRRVCGLVAVGPEGPLVFAAHQVVMATGGPGSLYADSVYPHAQPGSHAVCLAAGALAHNLTESQFGLASLRPRWNVSGSYQQVIPRYLSTDASGGDPREFLDHYFPDAGALGAAIFLKGYQWPFSAPSALAGGSSLVDLAVDEERRLGRRVGLDFAANPASLHPWRLERLGAQARDYLERSGATGDTPLARLARLNPEAVAHYAQAGVDLARQPLQVAVCAQHHNGGFVVDTWWQSTLPGLFIIGELAGTHGVVRPGGCALNAGQVGGLRAAQRIAHAGEHSRPRLSAEALARLGMVIHQLPGEGGALSPGAVSRQVRETMSRVAAFLRPAAQVASAQAELEDLWAQIQERGLAARSPGQVAAALRTREQVLTARAFLAALAAYLERGGGSRGSYLVLDDEGQQVHPALPGLRARPEVPEHRREVIEVSWDGRQFATRVVPVRPIPEEHDWYETTWRDYREGRVFADPGDASKGG